MKNVTMASNSTSQIHRVSCTWILAIIAVLSSSSVPLRADDTVVLKSVEPLYLEAKPDQGGMKWTLPDALFEYIHAEASEAAYRDLIGKEDQIRRLCGSSEKKAGTLAVDHFDFHPKQIKQASEKIRNYCKLTKSKETENGIDCKFKFSAWGTQGRLIIRIGKAPSIRKFRASMGDLPVLTAYLLKDIELYFSHSTLSPWMYGYSSTLSSHCSLAREAFPDESIEFHKDCQLPAGGKASERAAEAFLSTLISVYPSIKVENAGIPSDSAVSNGGAPTHTASPEERLRKVVELHEKGLISTEELNKKRAAILNEL
jgi:hypothetical protein